MRSTHSALQWSCQPFAALVLSSCTRSCIGASTCSWLNKPAPILMPMASIPECLHLSLNNDCGELLAYARLLPPGVQGRSRLSAGCWWRGNTADRGWGEP